ncbi:Reverse transcriptase zinc-binding domain [Sesbania bispinosa]|nr:Reverse transcriptase zinc-binding domain [Sesbania bispinosa]
MDNGQKDESVGSSSSIPFPWSKLWSANCIPRCKEFVWRACHNIIPVLIALQKKKIQLDHICPLCGEEPETTEHALLYCPQVAPIWFASQLGIAIDKSNSLTIRSWLQDFLNHNNKDAAGLIISTMWAIWKRRNLWVFKKNPLEFSPVLDMVTMNTSNMLMKTSLHIVQQRMVSWVRPEEHVYKANVDVAISQHSGAGLGVVFRISQGEVMASFIPHILDPTLTEALAIQRTMRTARQLIFTKVVFEADNQVCIQRLNSNTPNFSYLSSIVELKIVNC